MFGFDRRAAKVTWTASLVLLLLAAAYAVRGAVLVFVIAVFFAYMVHPLVELLVRIAPKRLSRGVITGIVFTALIAVIFTLAVLVGPTLVDQGSHLIDQSNLWAGNGDIVNRIPWPDWLVPYRARILAFVSEQVGASAKLMLPAAWRIGQGLLQASGTALSLVIVPILAFMLIKDAPSMRDRFLSWSDGGPRAGMWRGMTNDLDRLLGRYMRALVLLSLSAMVTYSIAFSLTGMPFALILALCAGIFEFVPVAGPLAAAVLILAVAALSGYPHLLGIAIFIAAYRVFQDYVLSPMLMSGGVSIPPLMVLFGLLAGAEVGGVTGVFLSVPLLAAARVLVARLVAEPAKASLNPSPTDDDQLLPVTPPTPTPTPTRAPTPSSKAPNRLP